MDIWSVAGSMYMTRTISAFVGSGSALAGQTVALKGTAGSRALCPAATATTPLLAGGSAAHSTVATAKFFTASDITSPDANAARAEVREQRISRLASRLRAAAAARVDVD